MEVLLAEWECTLHLAICNVTKKSSVSDFFYPCGKDIFESIPTNWNTL